MEPDGHDGLSDRPLLCCCFKTWSCAAAVMWLEKKPNAPPLHRGKRCTLQLHP